MSEVIATSLIDFIEKLPSRHSEGEFFYRGHQLSEWKLIPSLFRIRDSTDRDYIPYADTNHIGWIDLEKTLIATFKKHALPYTSVIPQNDLDWIALAQHHGLPTRFLDWTENSLVALFFAVEDPDLDTESSTVWIAKFREEHVYGRAELTDGVLYRPTFTTPRINAQRGCFTIHKVENGEIFSPFTAIEEREIIACVHSLQKIIIPRDRRGVIHTELNAVGIDYFSLFPDLDGLARKLKWNIYKHLL
jgi:hypothetical protein